jgi:transcriptional regulator with XRE-family HTH domain
MNASGFPGRLREARERRGIGSYDLARGIGRAGSYISMIETGARLRDAFPAADVLDRISRELNVSVGFLFGTEPFGPREQADNERPLLQVPPRLRPLTEQELYDRFGIKPYEEPLSLDGVYASAGPGRGVPQDIDHTVPRTVPKRKYLWEAPVVGDCMLDELKPGEVVIYSTRLPAEIGKIMVALRDDEELLIKRLKLIGGMQVLHPNRGEDVLVDERIRFLGRGVSVQRPLLGGGR